MTSLMDRYRPRSLKQFGTTEVSTVVRNFIESWQRGEPFAQAMLLHGPPGTGKTTLVRCAARTYGLELVDTNASADNSKEHFNKLWNSALSESFEQGKVIFIDEADNLTKRRQEQLVDIIKQTYHPVIIAANHHRDISDAVKNVWGVLDFEVPPPSRKQLRRLAKAICKKEGIPKSRVDRAVASSSTFRELVSVLQDPEAVVGSPSDDMGDRIRAALRDGVVNVRPGEYWACAAWVIDNVPGTRGGEFDKWWHRYKEVGRPMEKYIKRSLACDVDDVTFPWSIRVGRDGFTEEEEGEDPVEVEEVEEPEDALKEWF